MTTPPISKETVQAMLDAATPGPWQWRNDINFNCWNLSPGILELERGLTDGTPGGDEIDSANATAIASWPDLARAYLDVCAERDILLTDRENWVEAARKWKFRSDAAQDRGFALAIEAAAIAVRAQRDMQDVSEHGQIANTAFEDAAEHIRALTTKTALAAALEVPEIAALVKAVELMLAGYASEDDRIITGYHALCDALAALGKPV